MPAPPDGDSGKEGTAGRSTSHELVGKRWAKWCSSGAQVGATPTMPTKEMQLGFAFNLAVLHAHHNTDFATVERYPQPGRCHHALPLTTRTVRSEHRVYGRKPHGGCADNSKLPLVDHGHHNRVWLGSSAHVLITQQPSPKCVTNLCTLYEYMCSSALLVPVRH